jgi:hypothetical protein
MENLQLEKYLKEQSELDRQNERCSSGFFEDQFDSISVFSTDSTVVDSEIAERKVREFDKNRSLERKLDTDRAVPYNVHVDNVVSGNC